MGCKAKWGQVNIKQEKSMRKQAVKQEIENNSMEAALEALAEEHCPMDR